MVKKLTIEVKKEGYIIKVPKSAGLQSDIIVAETKEALVKKIEKLLE